MALVKSVLLIDGENLVLRYQAMLKSGRIPKKGVIHVKDVFVWHPEISKKFAIDIFRAIYYTSVVGDPDHIKSIKDKIALNELNTGLSGMSNYYGKCQLIPFVFKKEKKSQKSRLVDIFIAVDSLKYANIGNIECLAILSGDSDFIKVYNEVMGIGKKVYVGAFSSGCSNEVNHTIDNFFSLDEVFFEKKLMANPPSCR